MCAFDLEPLVVQGLVYKFDVHGTVHH